MVALLGLEDRVVSRLYTFGKAQVFAASGGAYLSSGSLQLSRFMTTVMRQAHYQYMPSTSFDGSEGGDPRSFVFSSEQSSMYNWTASAIALHKHAPASFLLSSRPSLKDVVVVRDANHVDHRPIFRLCLRPFVLYPQAVSHH